MTEDNIETEIRRKGLTAPRLTPDSITGTIKHTAYHVFGGTCLTVCCMTLHNGFTVTGVSEIDKKIAFENARDKIWMLEGYLLKQKLYEEAQDAVIELQHEENT